MTVIDFLNLIRVLFAVAQITAVALVVVLAFFIIDVIRERKKRDKAHLQKKKAREREERNGYNKDLHEH